MVVSKERTLLKEREKEQLKRHIGNNMNEKAFSALEHLTSSRLQVANKQAAYRRRESAVRPRDSCTVSRETHTDTFKRQGRKGNSVGVRLSG